MKVVHLLPALEQGGVETVVCDLVRVLSREGIDCTVVSKGGRLVGRVEANGGRHLAMDLKSKNPLTYLPRVFHLRSLLGTVRPDLVCVHSRVPAWLYVGVRAIDALLGAPGSTPWITYAHGANSVSRYSEVMTRGNLVVTPSRFLADYLKASYGTGDDKIRIVPNAVDGARFDPENIDRAFIAEKRREWGLEDDDRVLMAVGRITPVKGLDDLLRRFADEAAENPHLKLVIVGGADRHHHNYLESLRTLADDVGRRLGAQKPRIVFAGPQSKIPECLSIADEVVSANTTKPETFGLSVVEAYAMNRPVRAKRFGGVAEVMEAVERTNADSLRAAALSLYGLDKLSERTLAVYREALNMV